LNEGIHQGHEAHQYEGSKVPVVSVNRNHPPSLINIWTILMLVF
jgi:hypothetical protein